MSASELTSASELLNRRRVAAQNGWVKVPVARLLNDQFSSVLPPTRCASVCRRHRIPARCRIWPARRAFWTRRRRRLFAGG